MTTSAGDENENRKQNQQSRTSHGQAPGIEQDVSFSIGISSTGLDKIRCRYEKVKTFLTWGSAGIDSIWSYHVGILRR
jgi:hypothetical protein